MDHRLLSGLREQLAQVGAKGNPKRSAVRSAFGAGVAPEVRLWGECVPARRIMVGARRLAELSAPTLSEVVRRTDGNWVARFRGLFCGLSIVLEGDEDAVMASWVPLVSGSSRVFRAHQDEWSLSKAGPSLGGALLHAVDEPVPDVAARYARFDAKASKERHPASLDPAAMWKASEWLVGLFLDVSVRQPEAQIGAALPFSTWRASKKLIRSWPHVANYWLLAHWTFGNAAALRETLAWTANHKHPATVEIRRRVQRPRESNAGLESRRLTLAAIAPAKLLDPRDRKRRETKDVAPDGAPGDVEAARHAIEADRSTAKARALFDELARLATKDPYDSDVYRRTPIAREEFAAAVDSRWLPILLDHQKRAARVGDAHKLAIPGLLVGIAALSRDYGAFRKSIDALGTRSFGDRRQEEHAIAIGRFIPDRRAVELLVRKASAWAKRIDKWDVPVSPEYEHVLLKHELPETFELIRRVLSARQFHGGNWHIIVKTAIAAGALHATPALGALRGAISRGLGQNDPRERKAIDSALAALQRRTK